ncbi:MAG: histidine kinase [Dermatophilus congolensis]|nr:histidine kinase [Dermatophilus congolensis]
MRGGGGGLDSVIGWAQRHPLVVDASWALLWAAVGLAGMPSSWITVEQEPVWLAVVAANTVAVLLRRARPRLAIGILAVACVAHVLLLDTHTVAAAIAVFAAAHTANAQLGRRDRTVVNVLLLAGTAWAAFDYSRDVVDLPASERWPVVIVQWVLVGFFALLGALSRKRREELERAVEHSRMLERQQAQEIRLATLDERAHIAREMHDIVAHSLGVIIAQADGGRYAAATDPQAAIRALETNAQVGRDSLAEMRQLLNVLRSDDTRDLAPAPNLDAIPALADDFRKAGLDVRLATTGEPQAVSGTLALTGYRVVQESLSNALKHGGGTHVKVELTWEPGRLVIDVRNRLPESAAGGARVDPAGHGLVGMRERVSTHGGTLAAGPEGGLWRVRAELPLPRAATNTQTIPSSEGAP